MLRFHVVSLFPDFFASPLASGLMAKAIAKGVVAVDFYNPRDFAKDRRATTDDRPFGGGPGMVMLAEPLRNALNAIPSPGEIILASPAGDPLNEAAARALAKNADITIICGRYEGVDERICQLFPIRKISLCDAVLNGGETAALALMEAAARLAPGFMHKSESAAEESFSESLLEYPHYTRPEIFANIPAPKVLLSGDHKRVAAWRRRQALLTTLARRPDLLASASLTSQDAEWLGEARQSTLARNLSFALFHWPVRLDKRAIGASSLTNLDIHDIARISRSYGMGNFYVLTPLKDQLKLARALINHWLATDKDRAAALEMVRPVSAFAEIKDAEERERGQAPLPVLTSAKWPRRGEEKLLSPADIREICRTTPVLLCLGTARGLCAESLDFEYERMRPIRFLNENHLSVRAAAAIIADRILGDFY